MKMFKKEIVEGNKLIANFLKLKQTSNCFKIKEDNKIHVYSPEELLYHIDWNWLMQAVHKIESIREKTKFDLVNESFSVIIHSSGCTIESLLNNPDIQPRLYHDFIWLKNKKESTWVAVRNFIVWYNERNKK